MRIMLTGAGGFLGSRLFSYYKDKYEVWAPSHKELDFTREENARKAVGDFQPDVLLHCGAISDVGACERDPELSMRVNVEGTRYLARACLMTGTRMVMCSSNQVYFRKMGEKESTEEYLRLTGRMSHAVRFRSMEGISFWLKKPVSRSSRTVSSCVSPGCTGN